MCTVLLPILFNPTTVNKYINISPYRLCVNVYCVTEPGSQTNCNKQKYQHINIQFVFKCVLCYCRRVSTQLHLTNVTTNKHRFCVYISAVLLPIDFNLTTFKKCISKQTYTLFVNMYSVTANRCLTNCI